MKRFIFLLIILTSFAQAHSQIESWEEYLREQVIPTQEYFGELTFLKAWRTNRDFVIDPARKNIDLASTQLRCNTDKLWPSHPYQSTKEYHAALVADYDYTKLPANSQACTIPNPTRRFCQRAASAKLVITSDLYVDDCGNHYRAYWLTAYMSNHESMGTLFAKGRTAYGRAGSEFRGDYVTGATYGVKMSDFISLSPLTGRDRVNLNQVSNGIDRHFRKNGKLFIPR